MSYSPWYFGKVSFEDLELGVPKSRLATFGYALTGLGVILIYSPLADWLATRFFTKPPSLGAFIGGWLFGLLHINLGGGFLGDVATAFVGAVVLLLLLRALRRL